MSSKSPDYAFYDETSMAAYGCLLIKNWAKQGEDSLKRMMSMIVAEVGYEAAEQALETATLELRLKVGLRPINDEMEAPK